MAIKHNQPEELAKVILCYPKEKIDIVYSKVYNGMGRTEKRECDSNKSIEKKIECILKLGVHRAKFFDEMYRELYEDYPECGFEAVSEILDKCTVTNHLERIAYFLLCCSKDYKYFEKNISSLLSSDTVRKTINNTWESEPSFVDDESIHKDNNSNEEMDIVLLSEEKVMQTYYIGYIKKQGSYYNFYPIAKKDDNGLVSIESEELAELFPKHGGINLRTEDTRNVSYKYLETLDGIIDSYNVIPRLYAVKFTVDMLTDNNDDYNIQLKLDVDKIVDKDSIYNIIFEAAELGIYRIVEPDSETPNFIEGSIRIDDECFVGEEVLLYFGQRIYGPFKVLSNRNNEKTVVPNVRASKTPFLVDYWDSYAIQHFDTYITIFRDEYNSWVALADKKLRKQADFVRDSDIIESVATIVVDANNDSKRFLRELSESPLFALTLSEDILKRGQERALRLFELEENRKSILKSFLDGVKTNEIVEIFKDRVTSCDVLTERETEIETYKQKIDSLKSEIAKLQEGSVSSVDSQEYQKLETENQRLKEKNEQITSDFEDLQKQISSRDQLNDEIIRLMGTKDAREIDAKNAEEKKKKAEAEADKAVRDMRSKLDAVRLELKEQVSAAFDPMISSALIEAAGNFEADTEQRELEQFVGAIKALDGNEIVFSGDREGLLDYLVSNIQKYRKYSFNEIVNILICCTQNFLTVFSGEPGIGKTSICNIIANSLGLNLFEEYSAPNRFVPVSVEKGWATKRDLIGYYNPLTHRYDKSNSCVYNGLTLLDKEAENSAYPFIILLDEANLSQMEYYWADFMKAADRENELHSINIGTEKDLLIPKTLRFLATINNDETTVDLSPRLIDRAWVVHLPNNPEIVKELPQSYNDVFTQIIPWDSLCDVFDCHTDQTLDLDSETLLRSIYKEFEVRRINISPRIKNSIERYVVVASNLMEDEIGVSKTKIAIDYAVLQKLLPKISGIYESCESLLQKLLSLAETHNLIMTKKAIDDAINKHETGMDMGYCRFLI